MKTSTAMGFAQGSSDIYAGRGYDDTPPSQFRNRAQIKNYKLGYKHGYVRGMSGDASGLDINALARDVAKTAQGAQAAIAKVQQAAPQIKETLARTQQTLASTQQTVASIKSTGEWFKKNWYWLALGVGGSIAAIVVTVKMLRKPTKA